MKWHQANWLILFTINFCGANIIEKEQLNGANLRVATYEYPPFFSSQREIDGNITRSGLFVELTELLADYFQLRTVYTPVDQTEFKKYGFTIAMLRQLQNDEIDFSPFPYSLLFKNLEYAEFSHPLMVANLILLQPYPNETSRLDAPIKPFSSTVWLMFTIFTITFAITMAIIIYSRHISDKNQKTFGEQLHRCFVYVFKVITSEGSATPPELLEKFVFRLMLALWLLMMVVLINAYLGTYTAKLAVPKLEPTVDTLEELAASKLKMTIEVNSEISIRSFKAESGPYKVFGDSFRQHPELLFRNPFDAISNVVERGCAYPGAREVTGYYIYLDLKNHKKCRMTVGTKTLLYYMAISTGVQRGSPYKEIFDRKLIVPLVESGIVDYIIRKNLKPIPSRCLPGGQKPQGAVPLKMADFNGVFVLLLIGYGLGKLILLAELLAYRSKRQKMTNK